MNSKVNFNRELEFKYAAGGWSPKPCGHKTLGLNKKLSQLELKIDVVYSLASTLNSRYLEQNSKILLDLSVRKQHCESMQTANCFGLITRIVYDEWNELYDFFELCKQDRVDLAFSIFRNKRNFVDILRRRLESRKLANETVANLLTNSQAMDATRKQAKIAETIRHLNKYSEGFLHLFITKIDGVKEDEPFNFVALTEEALADSSRLTELNNLIADLAKRSYDEQHRSHLIRLGGAHALSEILTIVWSFLDRPAWINIIYKLTLNAITALNNLTFSNKLSADLNNELCIRKYWLRTVHHCLNRLLNRLLENINEPPGLVHDLIKQHACLIRNLSYKLDGRHVQAEDDQNMSGLITLSEINFAKLLTKCGIVYASKHLIKEHCLNLKIILNALLNLSTLSMSAKEKICDVNGSLKMIASLLKQATMSGIEELAGSLMRSLSVHCASNEQLRQKLRELQLYRTLLGHSLRSGNLNVVLNGLAIIWSLSSKSEDERQELVMLGAESLLIPISHTNHKLI